MKLLYIVNALDDGGAELGLLTLVNHGFFSGHDLTVQALARGNGTVRERLAKALGSDRVWWLFDTPTLIDRDLPKAVVKLIGILRQERPDAVILSLPQANLAGRLASLFVRATKVIAFEHSTQYNRRAAKHLMRASAFLVDGVFYDHATTWSNMRPLYPTSMHRSAYYVPMVVLFPRNDPVLIPSGRRRCLTTSRLSPEKNLVELFFAIQQAIQSGYDLDLTVAGEGPMRQELETLIAELDIAHRVRMTGFVEDLSQLRSQADIYIQVSTREGLAIAVLEAMAQGMIVVASDVGGVRHYGVDQTNMIKVKGFTREDVFQAVARALSLGQEARKIQVAALETIRSGFSLHAVQPVWTNAVEGLEKLVRDNNTGNHSNYAT